MTRSLDHLMATHDLANERRKAGRRIWDHHIHVVLTGAETFEEKRDRWVAALKSSAWVAGLDEFDTVRDSVEELADGDNADEFDFILSDIYDAADMDRVWINVQH
jgi:hypothetical protein